MSAVGRRELQTLGRSGRPNSRQRSSSSSWTQRAPAGLPSGIPGIGDEIEGAMQQAAQCGRQSMGCIVVQACPLTRTRIIHSNVGIAPAPGLEVWDA
jgi:hypothetical protein